MHGKDLSASYCCWHFLRLFSNHTWWLLCDNRANVFGSQARVESLGGEIMYWNGERVMGVLAVSRAIGDHNLRPFVIANPEVRLPCPCACGFTTLLLRRVHDRNCLQVCTRIFRGYSLRGSRSGFVCYTVALLSMCGEDRRPSSNIID